MKKELLDIVNEKDQIIGRDSRENVHANHQIHRGVHVLVMNSKGKILIQKRSKYVNDRPGNLDASVGGQVLSGENYKTSAIREVREELRIKSTKLIKICKYNSYSKRQKEKKTLYLLYNKGPFNFNKKEIEWVKFFDIEEINSMIKKRNIKFTAGFKKSLKKLTVWLKKGNRL